MPTDHSYDELTLVSDLMVCNLNRTRIRNVQVSCKFVNYHLRTIEKKIKCLTLLEDSFGIVFLGTPCISLFDALYIWYIF